MIKALTAASTGLQAQQSNIERVANDLSNVNTTGYKKGKIEFEDLMYETIREPGEVTGAGSQSPVGVQQGKGVKVGAIHKSFEQGPMKMTGNSYDLMVHGKGFFPVQLPSGEIAFTRSGAFHRDGEGRIVTTGGARLLPEIIVPSNAVNFRVKPDGEAIVDLPENQIATLGQIQLVRFANDEGLTPAGAATFLVSPASGVPQQGVPGVDGFGIIQQGALEGSNVNVASSMVEMIQAQRAYEMGTKVMNVTDKMMEATVNLK